jgi:hypothetical protein
MANAGIIAIMPFKSLELIIEFSYGNFSDSPTATDESQATRAMLWHG